MSDPVALDALQQQIVDCAQCPRLVEWRETVAANKRAAFADQVYWGRPVPGFGDPRAGIAVVGLAPAAHGANRTGRMFTGDRSGDWLYRAMWRSGFASQAASTDRSDGLELTDVWVTAPVRCAPPQNKPTTLERDACAQWLERELDILQPAVYVALGNFAYRSIWRYLTGRRHSMPAPRPKFGHGLRLEIPGGPTVLTSFHPSQQNTFTGRLTEEMLDDVFETARSLVV